MRSRIILLSVIGVSIIAVVAIVSFIFGFRLSQTAQVAGISTTQNSSPSVSTKEAVLSLGQGKSGQISESEQLVNSFYRFYINCLNQSGNCDYQNRPDLDYNQLTQKTREINGYDKLLCAQNVPKFFQIDHSVKDSDTLDSVYLVESFENDQVQLIVEVQKTDSGPKIVNVICPRP